MTPSIQPSADPSIEDVLQAIDILEPAEQVEIVEKIQKSGGITDALRLEIADRIDARVGLLSDLDEEAKILASMRTGLAGRAVAPENYPAQEKALAEEMSDEAIGELDKSYAQFREHIGKIVRGSEGRAEGVKKKGEETEVARLRKMLGSSGSAKDIEAGMAA